MENHRRTNELQGLKIIHGRNNLKHSGVFTFWIGLDWIRTILYAVIGHNLFINILFTMMDKKKGEWGITFLEENEELFQSHPS